MHLKQASLLSKEWGAPHGIAKSTKSFIKNTSELKRKKILGMTKLFNCIRSL